MRSASLSKNTSVIADRACHAPTAPRPARSSPEWNAAGVYVKIEGSGHGFVQYGQGGCAQGQQQAQPHSDGGK